MRFVKWVFLLAFPFVVGILSAERGVAQDKDEQRPPKGQLVEAPEITYERNRPLDLAKAASSASIIFEEDFEGEVSGWTEEGVWSIGEPTSGPGGGFESPSAGATNLSGDYPNDSDARLISPTISFPEVSSTGEILLHFREWFEIESGYDEGIVEISTDGGSTWTQLSSRSGSSDWRDTQVDLTSYAGEEVRIAFRFNSDFSITFPGWYVDDVQVSVDEPEPLSANIKGLNPQKFPFIFSNVEVDTSGSEIEDLSESNFEVYEDGTLQTDQFEVVPPEEGGGVRQTDIVFLIDNTGSMDDEIAQVRDNVIAFVDSLESSEIDFSLGLITYKDDVTTYFGGTLTSNASEFQETVGDLSATGGNSTPENGLGALQVGLNSISFRPGSQKVFVLITDATSHTPPPPYEDPPDPDPPSLNEINQSMNEAGVTTYAAAIDDPIYKGEGSITSDTGGSFFFVTEPFDSILDDIGEEVSNSYVVRYRSSNDERDGSERTVRVEVNYEGNTAQDTASYVAGGFPQIVRTEETRALEDQTWTEGTEFTIEAEITDNIAPLVQEATVFYKTTSDPTSAYESTAMSAVNDSLYEATIPGSAVDSPGLDYYITATDGEVTSSLPSTNPASTPYQIAILPNEPPEIEHTPVTEFTPGSPISVSASIVDNTDALASTTLYYRQLGDLTYTSVEMTNTSGNVYEAEIPGSAVTDDGIQYYIEATDNFDVRSIEGTADNPIAVGTNPFAEWPDSEGASITLKVVHPEDVDVSEVQLLDPSLKRREEGKSGPEDSRVKSISERVIYPKSASNNRKVSTRFVQFTEPEPADNDFDRIRLLNSDGQVVGYLPFIYTQANFEESISIDAIVYLHAEDTLQPDPSRWDDDWSYYDDMPQAHPLSMLIPPKGKINNVDVDQQDPVVLVHGVSGRYPSWGGVQEARELAEHFSEANESSDSGNGYDAWQFFYPENQDITKSGPLLAKALFRLRNNLEYATSQSFDLVAHSMGGLVSRHYIQEGKIGDDRKSYTAVLNSFPDPEAAIDKFLILGTPNHGSYGSYRCSSGPENIVGFSKCDIFGAEFFADKDDGAPAFRQMTPGSKFLEDLNLSSTASDSYSPSNTLVLAGTRNPNELLVTVKEIPNQGDGAVAVSSASLLDIGVPLAVGDYVHSAGIDGDNGNPGGDYDPRLNEDTNNIITSFLSESYDPGSPSDLGDITGFWDGASGGSADPTPDYENGLSMNEDEGVLVVNSEENESVDNISLENCGPLFQDSCLRLRPLKVGPLGDPDKVLKVPEQRRFFTYAETDDASTIGFNQISNGLDAGEQTVRVQERSWTITGIEWADVDEVSLTPKYLQTTQFKLLLDEEEGALVAAKAFVPGTALSGTTGSTSSKNSQTEEVQYQVDAETDTLTFWLTQDGSGDFSGHNMRLVSPDGSVIDSTTAKSESGLGYTQDLDVGSAIYVVEDPAPGRWTVRYDGSVSATVSAPITGSVDLQASAPDSTFGTDETVPVTVSVSDQNAYQDAEVEALLQVENPESGSPTKLGTIELTESSPTTYEGEFSSSYIGSHQVAVDFSAQVGGEQVRRRAVESVTVTGDSANVAPEPPAPPTDLSTQFDRSDGVTLNWSASGSGSVEEYRIYRDTIPNPVRQVATVSAGQTTYTDSDAGRGQTYYYRITAAGTGGVESVYTDASSIFAYPSSLPVQIERTFGDAEAEEDYRLVALPGQASGTLGETVSDDWRGFQEEGTSGDQPYSRSECEGGCQFGPGEGFWLITDQSWEVDRTVNTVSLSEAKTTQIDLQEGWNIVSNPLDAGVSWNAVQSASNTNQPLWQWDGRWSRAQTFAPATGGEAYYFRSDSLSQLTVPYPVPESVPQTKTDTVESQGQTLALSAVRGGERLSTVEAGIRPDAKNGLGPHDQFGPPGYFGEATLRLIRETDGRRHTLATEYVAPDGDGAVFDLVLHAEPDTTLTLQADGLEAFAEEEAVLVSQSTGKTYELVGDRETSLVPRTEETRYRLLVGSRSFVEAKKQETTPEDVELLPNYPNPFRARTTIEYALPEAADVRLSVYDVLGRRVAVLEDGRRERGFHRVRWDAGNRSLSSGVYFYRLRAGDETKSRQMVLLR